ncbi:amphi-Trp domain-containing protein [Halobacteria archaeon AArc-m2/3/4]|uniref:Amphi-Trp domain-containing protein n=1 Tax=Natronoglomus mannanivorans TaxID=2979990 RepID=A0AAP3E1Y3_9EURY|nr:amphi-Trp domain-containing protein [Halobacteria archaeon AArc-xg1-1]MCU4973303.1 amphi-Trp domain-containing protein [Halobacteria archaeon AArc-m2/3/4]
MPEEVLFKFEQSMDRAEIASYLRTVADRLESDEELSLEAADQHVTMSPPGRPTFEIKAERETSSSGGPAELSVEFELEWKEGEEGASGDGSLTIE